MTAAATPADADRAHQRGGQIGERACRTLATEIRHDEQRETPEDGEDDVLPAVENQRVESEDGRDDDRGACGTAQRGKAWIACRRKRQSRTSRRGRRLRAGGHRSARAHSLFVHHWSHDRVMPHTPQTGRVKR
jgi:hypothetical protein